MESTLYYRLLHKCTIVCTMLERVKLRFAGGEVLHDITSANGIILENTGRLSGSSCRVP